MKKIIISAIIVCILSILSLFSYLYMVVFQETVYSIDFSKNSFNRVSIGMDLQEVKDLLGEPLRTHKNPYEKKNTFYLIYSKSPNDTHYFRKIVIVQDSKVIEKIDEFYFD